MSDTRRVLAMEMTHDVSAPGRARKLVRRRLGEIVSGTRLDDLLLIVTEMVTLGLVNGSPGERLGLRIDRYGATLRIEMLDGGVPDDSPSLELIQALSDRTGRTGVAPVAVWAEVALA